VNDMFWCCMPPDVSRWPANEICDTSCMFD
jgi:hypothetical protein